MATGKLWAFLFAAMWCWLTVLAVNPLQYLEAETTSKGSEFLFPSPACEFQCRGAERTYFCASNGRTLGSMCRVREARCIDPYLNITSGKCRNAVRCRKERSHSLKVQSLPNFTQTVIVPSCKNDGSYASTQCNMFFGFCWCVTSVGKMVKNSTFKIGSPNFCDRSSGKRRCSTDSDKAAFALKLRDLIAGESGKRSPSTTVELRDAVNRRHEKMDRNGDGSLSSKEMKKLLKPYRKKLTRSCVKVFWKFCDFDRNRQISAAEWGLCLGVLPNMRDSDHSKRSPGVINKGRDRDTSAAQAEAENRPSHPVNHSSSQSTSPGSSERTCRTERLELEKGHKKNVNIPDCEGPNDEFWRQVQCHGKYCYCVVRETGIPVHSTSVSIATGRPNCKRAEISLDTPIPIPGCPGKLKPRFLHSVQKILIQEMAKNTQNQGEERESIKERAARWYFDTLDRNADRALGRKENKAFKKLLAGHRLSKKCLRKFTKHCDRNDDGKTNIEEFIGCLEVRRQYRPLPPYPDLRGSINQLKTTDDPDNF